GLPWGIVNYHPNKCGDGRPHRHVVWQKDDELRRATVYDERVFGRYNSPVADEYIAQRNIDHVRGTNAEGPFKSSYYNSFEWGWRGLPLEAVLQEAGVKLVELSRRMPSANDCYEYPTDADEAAHKARVERWTTEMREGGYADPKYGFIPS